MTTFQRLKRASASGETGTKCHRGGSKFVLRMANLPFRFEELQARRECPPSHETDDEIRSMGPAIRCSGIFVSSMRAPPTLAFRTLSQ